MKFANRPFPFHPFLFALVTIISLYMNNRHIVDISMVWLTVLVMLVTATLLLMVGRVLFKDLNKGAIWASIAVLLITNYSNYQDNLYDIRIPFFFKPIRMDQNFYLWSSLVLLLITWFIIRRTKGNMIRPAKLFNGLATILFVTSFFAGNGIKLAGGNVEYDKDNVLDIKASDAPMPDIYYFVMDAYGRADILQDLYNYDNSEFLQFLKDKGFYIADSATSNYGQTILSVPSALNMRYADEVAEHVGKDSENRKPLRKWMLHNKTVASLKSVGYKILATDASIFDLVTYDEGVDVFYKTGGTELNLFENHFLNTTIVRAFNDRKDITMIDQYGMHRKRLLNAFERIGHVPQKERGPYFVYGHILAPHQPFVFGENGEEQNPDYEYSIFKPREEGYDLEEYKNGYIGQLKFVNKKLMVMISQILENSQVPPIIIIQGDHGPASEILNINGLENNNFKERLSILNAYYFPDEDYSRLYDTISPINSFKVVFNQFFGQNIPLDKDKALYSTWYHPYDFHDMTHVVRPTHRDSISRDTVAH